MSSRGTSKKKIIVLTRDVENPEPDGRVRHNWTLIKTWKKGTRLVVDTFDVGIRYGLKDEPSGVEATEVYLASRPYGRSLTDRHSADRIQLILDNSVEEERSVRSVLSLRDYRRDSRIGTAMFERLVERGVMTVDEFESHLDEYEQHLQEQDED